MTLRFLSSTTPNAILLVASLTGLWAPGARAWEGDLFRPLAFINVGHDDNIFRVRDDVELAAPFSEDDTYTQWGVGFLLDWRPGRQKVWANVRLDQTRFQNNPELLDYDGQDIRAGWDWQLGNLWNGQLGHDRQRTLGSFLNAGLVENVRTSDSTYFNAVYRFHSRWQAKLGLRHYQSDYSAEARSGNNVESDTTTLGLYYTGREVGHVGAEIRFLDGEFPDRVAGSGLATRFKERFAGAVADWTFSGKTRLKGRLGVVDRENTDQEGRDFNGMEARLDADWTPTGKLLVNATLNRELNHTDVTDANHEVVTGVEVNATWFALPKTRLGAGVSYRNLEYDGSDRSDDVVSMNLNAGYQVTPGAELTVQVRHESRDSSDINYDKTRSTSLFLGASIQF